MPIFKLLKKLVGSKKKSKKAVKKPAKKTIKKPQKKINKKKASKTQKKAIKKSAAPVAGTKEKEVGIITHWFGKISVGIIKLKKAGLKVGDKIHIKGAHDDFTQGIDSMQLNHKDIKSAPKGKEIGIRVTKQVHENDKVYLTEP